MIGLLNKPPEAYLLMKGYMPNTLDSIFGIRALVMQLLDEHPYCSNHLVQFHLLGHPSLALPSLQALPHEFSTPGHIDSCHCFESTLAHMVSKKIILNILRRRQAYDFTTCTPRNITTATNGRL